MSVVDTKSGVLTRARPAPQPPTASRGRGRGRRREAWIGLVFVAPALLLVAAVVFYPIAETFLMSLENVNQLAQPSGWVGFANYTNLFGDGVFVRVLLQTLIWTITVVGVTTAVSIPVALALNLHFPGRRVARAVLMVPWAASLMINALIWRWILDGQDSILSRILTDLHIIHKPVVWLGSTGLAFSCEIIVGILVSIPFTSFSLLAGLQAIPADVYEAALLDGAGFWTTLRRITLPLLRPTLAVTTLLNVIYVFNSFPIVWLLTQGAPAYHTDIVPTYLYTKAFTEDQFGQSSAMAVLTFLILLVFSFIYSRVTRDRSEGAAR